MRTLVGLLLLLLPLSSWALPRVQLVAADHGGAYSDRPVQARLGEPVTLHVVVAIRQPGATLYYTDLKAPFRLGWRRVRRSQIRPLSWLRPQAIRWYRVEPRPHHLKTSPPNSGNPAYSNARLFGPRHGQWIGYDSIEYHETRISKAQGSSLRLRRTHPAHPRVNVNGGLGTMRYKVSIRLPDTGWISSAGIESVAKGGIGTAVLRVTFRSGDRWVDYLRGFFNVPNVFGSAGRGPRHQTERYQGADCADVIVGALRAAGARIPYTSARGLLRYARPISERYLLTAKGLFSLDRSRTISLAFGKKLRPGDIMLIDYVGFAASPRDWDHVAVLDRDRGVVGIFDPKDPVMHMGYLYGLTEEPAAGEAPAIVQFLRLRRRYQRQIDRVSRNRLRRERRHRLRYERHRARHERLLLRDRRR